MLEKGISSTYLDLYRCLEHINLFGLILIVGNTQTIGSPTCRTSSQAYTRQLQLTTSCIRDVTSTVSGMRPWQ